MMDNKFEHVAEQLEANLEGWKLSRGQAQQLGQIIHSKVDTSDTKVGAEPQGEESEGEPISAPSIPAGASIPAGSVCTVDFIRVSFANGFGQLVKYMNEHPEGAVIIRGIDQLLQADHRRLMTFMASSKLTYSLH